MAAFDTTAYLNNKAAQLNEAGHEGKSNWTVADVKKSFADSGLSAEQHYNTFGKSEGVSPTNSSSKTKTVTTNFDTSAYHRNKADQLNQTGYQGRLHC